MDRPNAHPQISQMADLLHRIERAFHPSPGGSVYGRETEKQAISAFLKSSEGAIHITGSPGSGKTCTVKEALRGHKHRYINYCHEPCIGRILAGLKEKIVVIDEFDKYFLEKKNEAVKSIVLLRRKSAKLITISNNLRMGSLCFRPYAAGDILRILREKMAEEVGAGVADEAVLAYVARKFDRCGDLRLVFKFVLDAFKRKAMDHTPGAEENKSTLNRSKTNGTAEESMLRLKLADCICKEVVKTEKNMHHEIIQKTAEGGKRLADAYAEYLKECQCMNIPIFSRQEFEMVFAMINKK